MRKKRERPYQHVACDNQTALEEIAETAGEAVKALRAHHSKVTVQG